MAGGGNKKKFNKPKSRKFTKPSLFVEGGLLSDWSPIITSPPSKGKTINSNSTGNKLNASKNKSAVRFEIGSSSGGKSKASSSVSRKRESQKPKTNAFAYKYPQVSPLIDEGSHRRNKLDESNPIVLVDSAESKIIAYIDQTPAMNSEPVKYTYDHGASFEVDDDFHTGLGFHDEAKETTSVAEASPATEKQEYSGFDSSSSQEMDFDMMANDDSDVDASASPVTNSGFLSIGGMKLYTHDISSEEEDDEEDDDDDTKDNDEESIDSSDSEDSNSSDSDGAYNSDSDIDDEIAKDYFEGIGRIYNVANVDQLVGQVADSSDEENDETSGGHYDEMVKELGKFALQDASREYGMQKPHSRKKSRAKPSKFAADVDDWSAIDDLMLVKNSRSLYGKKKHAAKLPQSWPSKAEKSRSFRRFSGEKKKLRQDRIALKRRQRMISRGVDLEKINSKLEQMVRNKGDIMSFHLMHSRDCSQVQKLAAIYRLRSGSQGSGKKRFVTVTRTQHTSMPSSSDRVRLEKLLQIDDKANNITPGDSASNKTKKASTGAVGLSPLDSKSSKKKAPGESSKTKRRDRDKTGSYAAQPVSFISSGNMVPEPAESQSTNQTLGNNKAVASLSSYGAFEMHTTGFGSRMMAKMGYVEGGGLGKDGRGIAEPIEVIQRPKSLGLGAKAKESSNALEHVNVTPPQKLKRVGSQSSRGGENKGKGGDLQFGCFEKHTKGFGSKMMAKMGFVEGMGLGRDSQGIVQPLVASRLPRSRGLGAKG